MSSGPNSRLTLWLLVVAAQAVVGQLEPLQSSLLLQFAEQHKGIPRIIYFTCRRPLGNETDELRESNDEKNYKLIKSLYDGNMERRHAFVRVVQLDVLRQLDRKRGRPGSRAGGGQSMSSGDWLSSVLQVEALRQIVAVDLACGVLSRRLLQLASGKMLYNAKYHWLLIEDYGLHMAADKRNVKEQLERIEDFMEGLNFYINTELTLAKRSSLGVSYTLYDAWSAGLNYGGRLNITEIGSYTQGQGFRLHHWFACKTTLLRRMDMQLARVRSMVVVTNKNVSRPLLDYLTRPIGVPKIDLMNRFNFNLMLNVRDMFNWSFVLSRTASWGYVKNGRYDGLIGALIRNETDIGGSPVFYWPERHKWIDVAGRSWHARPCFIFRHPHNTMMARLVFLQPFTNDVWLLILLCGIVTVLILWLLTTIEWKLLPHFNTALIKPKGGMPTRNENHNQQAIKEAPTRQALSAASAEFEDEEPYEPLNITGCWLTSCYLHLKNYVLKRRAQHKSPERVGLFLESVLFFVGIICQQGLGFSTKFISGRCIVIISLLFSFCIYQFYSASIVGTLLMERPKTIKTLSDLVQSSLQLGIEDIVYNRDYFLHTKDPVSMELYAKKITSTALKVNEAKSSGVDTSNTNTSAKSYKEIVHSHEVGAHAKSNEATHWLDPIVGMRKVKLERFAYHVEAATAYPVIAETFTDRDICDLTEISMFSPPIEVVIMQKHSPMRKAISYGLRRITESGIFAYHIHVWHARKPPCVKQIETSDLHVDMNTVSSALIILLCSYGIALVILCLEIMYSKWQNHIFKILNLN